MQFLRNLLLFLILIALLQGVSITMTRAEDGVASQPAGQHQVREAFAKDFAQKVLAIMQDPKKSYANNKDLLRTAFSKSVDIDWIAHFVLGHHWNAATPEQREHYTELYHKYLTETYVSNFGDDPQRRIRDIKIYGVNDNEGDDFTVHTEMMLANFDSFKVNYLVRDYHGYYKVIDIVIENVSLIETHRQEFAALARAQGVTAVIERLEHLVNAPVMTLTMK